MKSPKNSLAIVALVAALSGATVSIATAATLVSDDFTGVTDLNADGWYFGNGGATPWVLDTPSSPPSPISGQVMSNPGSSSGWAYSFKQFTPVTLASTGDYLTLSFSYYINLNANNGAGWLGISLLNSSSTITTNDFGGNPVAGSTGYTILQSSSTSATDAEFQSVSNGDSVFGGSSLGWTSGTAIIGDFSSAHTITLTLTKGVSDILLDYSVDGVSLGTASSSSYATFNTLRFLGQPGNANDGTPAAYFDNILLTTNVPEPSVTALIIGAGLFVLVMRNRGSSSRLS